MKRITVTLLLLVAAAKIHAEVELIGTYYNPAYYVDFTPKRAVRNAAGEIEKFDVLSSYNKSDFWDGTKLTPMGYYLDRLSGSPDFMIKHLKHALDPAEVWTTRNFPEYSGPDIKYDSPVTEQWPNYKAIHRVFNAVAAYRLLMRDVDSGGNPIPHSHSRAPDGQVWASAVEDFFRSRVHPATGRITNADGTKQTHLAMQFHLLGDLTGHQSVLGLDATKVWSMDDAQDLVREILTRPDMIQPTNGSNGYVGGLWQAIEIVDDRPSLHATYDALAIINRLFLAYTRKYNPNYSGGHNFTNFALHPNPDPAFGNGGNWIFKKWYTGSPQIADTALNRLLTDINGYLAGTLNDGSTETLAERLDYAGRTNDNLGDWGVLTWRNHYH